GGRGGGTGRARTPGYSAGRKRVRPGPRASLHLERRRGGRVPPRFGNPLALPVVPGEAADPGLHQRQAATVREVLGMGLEVPLQVDDPLQQRLEVVRDLGRDAAASEQDAEPLSGHRPCGRYPVAVPEVQPHLSGGEPRLRKLDGLRDQLLLGHGDPLGLGEGVRSVRTGTSLVSGVDPRHGFAGTLVRYLTAGALRASTEGETAVPPSTNAVRLLGRIDQEPLAFGRDSVGGGRGGSGASRYAVAGLGLDHPVADQEAEDERYLDVVVSDRPEVGEEALDLPELQGLAAFLPLVDRLGPVELLKDRDQRRVDGVALFVFGGHPVEDYAGRPYLN